MTLDDGAPGFVTVHPSVLLRIQDATDEQCDCRGATADWKRAADFLKSRRAA